MRRAVGEGDDADRHDDQPDELGRDGGGAARDVLVQPDEADADGYQGVGDRADGQNRGYQGALLEGVLVEQEAERLGDDERVERPLLRWRVKSQANGLRQLLEEERRDSEDHAAGDIARRRFLRAGRRRRG